MRMLVTADWQAEWENLDLCKAAAEEVQLLVREHKIRDVIFAGDLKRHYNPVDVRVTQFWTDFIHWLGTMCRTHILLGNHDRVGMYAEATNWLPILQRAGAHVIHEGPELHPFGFAFLPFSSSVDKTKLWAAKLAKQLRDVDRDKYVLIFHNDLKGCAYNVLGNASNARLKASDLHPDSYRYCLGGHVHLCQEVAEKVWYVGSPFATDWGEANQKKGYAIVTDKEMWFEQSEIPGWYDPKWPGFPKNKTKWDGCRVRIHVPMEVGQNYPALLEKARIDAERKYSGGLIYTIPEFKEEKTDVVEISASDSDTDKICGYVEETLPEVMRKRDEQRVAKYLAYKLKKASEGLGLRTFGKIEFIGTKAKKFLSYENLEIDYREPGLYLIVAKNHDWMGRSNGGGKSNYLQPIPVALFGKTFKDQKHDAWACDKIKGKAWVSLKFKDGRNRLVKVIRTRRPGKLRLYLNGKEQSSGMQSTAQSGTQGLVEKISGFTWQTLANAVYIDQEQVSQFLSGTPSEQKKILERFQNLERFAKAQELVKEDLVVKVNALTEAGVMQAQAQTKVNAYKEVFDEQSGRAPLEHRLKKLRKLIVVAKREYIELANVHKRKQKKFKPLINEQVKIEREAREAQEKWIVKVKDYQAEYNQMQKQIERMEEAGSLNNCMYCQQPIQHRQLTKQIEQVRSDCTVLTQKSHRAQQTEGEFREAALDAYTRMDEMRSTLNDLLEQTYNVEETISKLRQRRKDVQLDLDAFEKEQFHLEKKIRLAEKDVHFWTDQSSTLDEERQVLEYCVQAFSRNGIPAFLNAQLCPQLNKSALFYSEVFTGKEIQVRFSVEEAEFNVEIINAHGGKSIGDQSAGEKKMAAIIASFALRSVAPPCNLLVLDEPGDGLDATNAKAFATGLKSLKKELGTVFLTTHNPVILAELSGEDVITIEKKGGISRVVE